MHPWSAIRHLPVRRPRSVRLYGLLAVKDEMRYLPGWFATNARHLDGVIVYDDGSTDGSAEFAAAQPGVIEVLHRPIDAPPGWDESRTRRALYEAAGRHGADWLVAIDADERLESAFGVRARQEITRLGRRGIDAAAIRVLELWDAPDRVRVDGVWNERWRSRLFRWRPGALLDDRRLHGQWSPLDATVRGGYVQVDLTAYHLHMIEAADRAERVARYERLDPEHAFQAAGYEYLTDPSGLRTEPLATGRGYEPLHRDPRLAVVVLAVGCPPTLPAAVASLLAQEPRPEVCVVSSGAGTPPGARDTIAPLGVRVIETEQVLLPGAARNLGIAHTRAPIVAFLAADCIAQPGWVAARLAAHEAGARAVASALVDATPSSVVARAAHVVTFGWRLPGIPARRAGRYGVSYDRALLAEAGGFREDLRTSEDTELNERLGVSIAWDPRVHTAHRGPTTAGALWQDQTSRGRHIASAWTRLRGWGRLRTAASEVRSMPRVIHAAWSATPHAERAALVTSMPWLAVALTARLTGILRAPRGGIRR